MVRCVMPLQHAQGFCPHCQRKVLIQRDAPNHLIHALVTLVTCVWGIVWLLVSMDSRPWLCSQCGTEVKVPLPWSSVALLVFVIAAVAATVVTVAMQPTR